MVCQDENGYTANDCVERIKPDEQRACESGPCPQWAYGSWGEVRAIHLSFCPFSISEAYFFKRKNKSIENPVNSEAVVLLSFHFLDRFLGIRV